MTRKDYILIAGVLREFRQEFAPGTLGQEIAADLARKMAVKLKNDNTNFNKDRFMKAVKDDT